MDAGARCWSFGCRPAQGKRQGYFGAVAQNPHADSFRSRQFLQHGEALHRIVEAATVDFGYDIAVDAGLTAWQVTSLESIYPRSS